MSCQVDNVCYFFILTSKKAMVRYKVILTENERVQLRAILSKGKHSSLKFLNACILLNSDESDPGEKVSDEQIAKILQITTKTIERLKQQFVDDGFEACMEQKPYPEAKDIMTDEDFETHLLAISCSQAPDGYNRWSLRMLADKMVALNYAGSVSHETIRQVLKKRN